MLYHFISRLYDKKVDALGLSLFRIAIGAVLFAEVLQLLRYRRLIFDVTPYLEFSAILDYKYALLIWLLVIVCLILGLFTRVVVIINYVLSVLFFATNKDYGNLMLQVFMTINFLLLFTNVSAVWSLDAVLHKLRTGKVKYAPKVSVLNYYSFVLMAIGLIYFVSLFDKYFAEFWRNGMVFYRMRSLPEFGTFNIQWLLNQKWLMMGFSYFTLAFETIFIVVCFKKKWRPYICIAGMALHFGIFLFFPFKIFALGFMALYLLMVPFRFWKVLGSIFRTKSSTTVFLNSHHPMAASVDIIIRAFDLFGCFNVLLNKSIHNANNTSLFLGFAPQKGITSVCRLTAYVTLRLPVFTLLGLLLYIPIVNVALLKWYKLLLVYSVTIVKNTSINLIERPKNNPVLKQIKINMLVMACILLIVLQSNAVLKTRFAKTVGLPSANERMFKNAKALFGIGDFGVFCNSSASIHLYTIAITKINTNKEETWLPLTQFNGEIDRYKKEGLRRKTYYYTFKFQSDTIRLNTYIKDFTAFWSFENNIDLDNADFNVYVKKYDVPSEWKENVYQKNLDKPWVHLGEVIWRDTLFYPQLDVKKAL